MITMRHRENDYQSTIRELRQIPSVGVSVAVDLYDLGYRTIDDLRGADPDEMYEAHCRQRGARVDRCVLYTFRCAVYFAETPNPDPEKLKWWNWSDRKLEVARKQH